MKWMMVFALLITTNLFAKSYEIFDGRYYNGLYYPKIDVITWREKETEPFATHLNIYWKGHVVDLAFDIEDKGAEKILLVHYFIKERNEHLCRRIPAPGNFVKGPVKVYLDTKDKDMDKYIVAQHDMSDRYKEIKTGEYKQCEEPKEPETNELGGQTATEKTSQTLEPTKPADSNKTHSLFE